MNASYWDNRYKTGVGAGSGSRGPLYEFKLRTVQDIVDKYSVKSVVDVGCGDGGQMMGLKVESYMGLDISPVAIESAQSFASESRLYQVISAESTAEGKTSDMAISLDVIQHLEDDQFAVHMDLLFRLAKKYVLIYAPNHDGAGIKLADHMRFRFFHKYIAENFKSAKHDMVVLNEYPANPQNPSSITSFSDFYLYEIDGKRKRTGKASKES